jgi:hypothetical protein
LARTGQIGGCVNANHLSWWIWGEAFPVLLLNLRKLKESVFKKIFHRGPNFVGMLMILSVLAKVSHFNGSFDAHAQV